MADNNFHYMVEDKSGKRFTVPAKGFDPSKYAYVRMINRHHNDDKTFVDTRDIDIANEQQYRFMTYEAPKPKTNETKAEKAKRIAQEQSNGGQQQTQTKETATATPTEPITPTTPATTADKAQQISGGGAVLPQFQMPAVTAQMPVVTDTAHSQAAPVSVAHKPAASPAKGTGSKKKNGFEAVDNYMRQFEDRRDRDEIDAGKVLNWDTQNNMPMNEARQWAEDNQNKNAYVSQPWNNGVRQQTERIGNTIVTPKNTQSKTLARDERGNFILKSRIQQEAEDKQQQKQTREGLNNVIDAYEKDVVKSIFDAFEAESKTADGKNLGILNNTPMSGGTEHAERVYNLNEKIGNALSYDTLFGHYDTDKDGSIRKDRNGNKIWIPGTLTEEGGFMDSLINTTVFDVDMNGNPVSVKASVEREAYRRGMSLNGYISKVLYPEISAQVMDRLFENEVARNMPKDNWERFQKSFKQGFLGQIQSILTKNATQRNAESEALERYDKEHDLGLGMRIVNSFGTTVSDAPLLIAGGKVGELTAKGAAAGIRMAGNAFIRGAAKGGATSKVMQFMGSYAPKVADIISPAVSQFPSAQAAESWTGRILANLSRPKWYAANVIRGGVNGTANMQFFMGAKGVTEHVYAGGDTSGSELWGAYLTGAAEGLKMGGAMALTGPVAGLVFRNPNTLLKSFGVATLGKTMEVGTFMGMDYLDAYINDTDVKFNECLSKNIAMVAGMAAATHPVKTFKSIVNGARRTMWYKTTMSDGRGHIVEGWRWNPVKAWQQLTDPQSSMAMSDEALEHVRSVLGNDASVMDMFEFSKKIYGRSKESERLSVIFDEALSSGDPKVLAEAQKYSDVVFNLIEDTQNVPWTIRNEIAVKMFGLSDASKPLFSYGEIVPGTSRMRLFAEDGELIDIREVKTLTDYDILIEEQRLEAQYHNLRDLGFQMLAQGEKGLTLQEDIMRRGLGEEYAKILTTPFDRLTDEQRLRLGDYLNEIKDAVREHNEREEQSAETEAAAKPIIERVNDAIDADSEEAKAAAEEAARADGANDAERANLTGSNPDASVVEMLDEECEKASKAYNDAYDDLFSVIDKIDALNIDMWESLNTILPKLTSAFRDGYITEEQYNSLVELALKKETASRRHYAMILRRDAFVDRTEEHIKEIVDRIMFSVVHAKDPFVFLVQLEGDDSGRRMYLTDGNVNGSNVESESGIVVLRDELGNTEIANTNDVTVLERIAPEAFMENARENLESTTSQLFGLDRLMREPAAEEARSAVEGQPEETPASEQPAEPQQPASEQPTEPTGPMVPEGKPDEPVEPVEPVAVDPKKVAADLKAELGDVAGSAVDGEIAKAQKALDDANAMPVDGVDSARAKKTAVDKAQQNLDHWNAVKKELIPTNKGNSGGNADLDEKSVPDWTRDKASDARERGYRMQNGEKVERQGKIDGVKGNEVEVDFATNETVKATLKVVDAGSVQPSHIGRDRNILHFIPEAQPKERTDAVSDVESDRIAQDIKPDRITDSTNAYGGAPIVNERGEVIQGNNRAIALKKMQGVSESKAKYKQYLMDHAEEFGLKAEDIEKMENPVLVREVKVSDDEAIRLGQFSASDLETGGIERIDAKKTLAKLDDVQVGETMRRLFDSAGEDMTIGQLIDENGVKVLKHLNRIGAISNTQYQSAFDKNGRLTEEAKNDLRKLMLHNIFEGGSDNLNRMFDQLPSAAQKGLLHAMAGDMRLPEESRLRGNVQKAIEIVSELLGRREFQSVKGSTPEAKYKNAKQLLKDYIAQADAFNEPLDKRYSELEMEIALHLMTDTQNKLKAIFKEYQRLIIGESADLFTPAEKLSRSEAIERVFNVKEKGGKDNGNGREDKAGDVPEGGSERGGQPPRRDGGNRGADGGRVSTLTRENALDDFMKSNFEGKEKANDLSDSDKEKLKDLWIELDKAESTHIYRKRFKEIKDLLEGNSKDSEPKEPLDDDTLPFDKRIEGQERLTGEQVDALGEGFNDYTKTQVKSAIKKMEEGKPLSSLEQLFYLKALQDVRNTTRGGAEDRSDADPAQLGSGDNGSAAGADGREGGETLPLDRPGSGEDASGAVRTGANGEEQSGAVSGEGGDRPVSGAESADDGVSVRGVQPEGSNRTGSNGRDVRSEGGEGTGNAATGTDSKSEIQSSLNANKKKALDALARLAKLKNLRPEDPRNNFEAGAALASWIARQGERVDWQALGEFGEAISGVAYDYVRLGMHNFKEWAKQVGKDFADVLKDTFDWNDAEVDDYIKEMWNSAYEIDGKTHTIAEWASIIGRESLRKEIHADLNEKKEAQRQAESVEVKVGDRDNIDATLPYLLPAQRDDVMKAETQFFNKRHQNREHGNGKGMMFTNGTGTGKTYTGLGIVKRFVKQGKGRVLIVTPSQPKITDWIRDGKNLGLDINSLENMKDAGEGVVITTFANIRGNEAILGETFDLIVYDESHKIMENKKGEETVGTQVHYQLTNKDMRHATDRIEMTYEPFRKERELRRELDDAKEAYQKIADKLRDEYDIVLPKVADSAEDIARLRRPIEAGAKAMEKVDDVTKQELDLLQKAENIVNRKMQIPGEIEALKPEQEALMPEIEEKAKEAVERTKTVFLSATPFNTRESLKYAEGYIFSYPEEDETTKGTYNHRSPEQAFFESRFSAGYRWRYGRLEQHTENPKALENQEIQFSDYLQDELGTLSTRQIDNGYDYSRTFPTVTLDKADRFNEALQNVMRDPELRALSKMFHDTFFEYNRSTALFEAMKTSLVAERIKEHIARGRKVVVFHRRRTTKDDIENPFQQTLDAARVKAEELAAKELRGTSPQVEELLHAIRKFELEYDDLLQWEGGLDYRLPREQLASIFGADKVAFFSGEETKKQKEKSIEDFMNDNDGKPIIVIQEASGKEGISLHDMTGEHERVEMSLCLPQSPIAFIQIEGRIYRIGQKSNAIFEYPLLGLDLEMNLFAGKFNASVGTTENLAMGTRGRNIADSIARGVLEHSGTIGYDDLGIGGKEFDGNREQGMSTGFDRAIQDYFTNQKMQRGRENREGKDYFPTPEPLGFKMVEWANMTENDTVLEPSAGHGAIARYVPGENLLTVIEPSHSLMGKLMLNAKGTGRVYNDGMFEDYNVRNKHDVVVMNPPYGTGGKTAIEHVSKAFDHLSEGGRVIAIIPEGPSSDKRLDAWLASDKGKTAVVTGEVHLPDCTFGRAGTSVRTKIVVIDKITRPETRKDAPDKKVVDLRHIDDVHTLFDEIRDIDMPRRTIDKDYLRLKAAKSMAPKLNENKAISFAYMTDGMMRIQFKSRYLPDLLLRFDSIGTDFGAIDAYNTIKQTYDGIKDGDWRFEKTYTEGRGSNKVEIREIDAVREALETTMQTVAKIAGKTVDQLDRMWRERKGLAEPTEKNEGTEFVNPTYEEYKDDFTEKPTTKEGWLTEMRKVYHEMCNRLGLPQDNILYDVHKFYPRITKGYQLDAFEPAYEGYKKKLNEMEIEHATDKQMAFIQRLCNASEWEALKDARLTKQAASYVIDLLKASENAIRPDESVGYSNEVKKVAELCKNRGNNAEMMLSEGKTDEFANDTEAKQVVTDFVTETLGGTDGIELVHNTQEEGQKVAGGQANNTELMAGKNVPERANKIAKTNGIVSSGLASKIVNIVSAEAHPFDVNKKTTELKKDVVAYAEDNGIIGTMNNDETNGKGSITISKGSIGKFVDDSATNKSVDKDIHLSVLPKIRSIIAESVLAETHPDYNRGKDGKHSPDNGFNNDVLIHRLYGAVEFNGEVYRVKTTIKEATSRDAMKAYSYEVTEIELLPGQKEGGENRLHRNENNSITGAKLLKNVEKSYDKGKKLLDESKNNAELMQVFHGSAAAFDHFDSSHFMEGEGSMVYGAGHYVTNVESTGRMYANIATENKLLDFGVRSVIFSGDREGFSEDIIKQCEGWVKEQGYENVKQFLAEHPAKTERQKEIQDFFASTKETDWKSNIDGKRQLYKIEIPDDNGGNYIDWNEKPTKEQLRKVGRALSNEDVCNLLIDMKFDKEEGERTEDSFYDMVSDRMRQKIENKTAEFDDEQKAVIFEDWFENSRKGKTGQDLYSVTEMFAKDKVDNKEDVAMSKFLSNAGFTGIKVPTGNKKGGDGRGMNYVVFKDGDLKIKNRVEFLESKGTVYGWAEGNTVHLTPEGMNPNTPIHEYTHLWAKAIQKKAPELWNNIKSLLKDNPLVKEVLGEKGYEGLDEDGLYSEVLSRVSGKNNAGKLEEAAQRLLDAGHSKSKVKQMLSDFKEAIKKAWSWIGKELFGIERFESVEEVTDRILYDLINKTDLKLDGTEEGVEFHKLDPKKATEHEKEVLKEFEEGKTKTVYRAMQVIDGKLYPPMAAKVGGKMVEGAKKGDVLVADEHPELIKFDKSGKPQFVLDKGGKDATGKKATSVPARYNPYWHTSNSPMNDQFKSAWIRPNMVVVECEIPESELTSGYKAEYAKDAVGMVPWKSGSVTGELVKQGHPGREVYLSRYCKIGEVLSDEQAAKEIKKFIGDKDVSIPENVVTPKLREALEKEGVKIGAPEKGVNKSEQIQEALDKGLEVDNTLYRRGGEHTERTEQQTKRVAETTQAAIDGLDGKGRVVTGEADMTEADRRALHKQRNAMGWYDTKTGEVVVYLPNCRSEVEAQRTVLHEKVGHEGLRGVFGEKGFKEFLRKLWVKMTPEERHGVTEKMQRNGWDYLEAMDEHLAVMAEDFSEGTRSLWTKIKDTFNDVMRALGWKHSSTEDDIRTALWLSKNRLTGNRRNVEYWIRRRAFESKVKRMSAGEERSVDGWTWGKDSQGSKDVSRILFSRGMKDSERQAILSNYPPDKRLDVMRYERRLKDWKYAWSEAYGDRLKALDVLVETITKKSGNDIPDFYNVSRKLRALGGKNQTAQDNFRRRHFKPLMEHIDKLQTKFDGASPKERYEALEDYAYVKHGLERNRVLFISKACEQLRKNGDEAKADALQQAFDAERATQKTLLDSGRTTLADYYDAIDDFIRTNCDASYAPSKTDYSGLSDAEYEPFKKNGIATGVKGEYDDAAAIAHVMNCEAKIGAKDTAELWDRITAISHENVEREYNAGLIDKRVKDRMTNMFSWYLPLRGFDAKTAEEQYGYIENRQGGHLGSNERMKGRGSAADMPISTLCAMADYSIVRSNKNEVKKGLVALARDSNSPLLTEYETWYKVDTVGGVQTLTPFYPELKENMTPAEIKDKIDDLEATVQNGTASGETWVRLKDFKTNVPYRIVEPKDRAQHIVSCYLNGKRVDIIVNGNPRAAQAVNGLVHDSSLAVTDSINRFMQQLFTSYSLTFMARNMPRDYFMATSSGIVADFAKGERWNRDFQNIYASLAVGGDYNSDKSKRVTSGMRTLFRKYRNGELKGTTNDIEKYFVEFIENGGMTGYTSMKGKKEWEDDIYETLSGIFGSKKSSNKAIRFISTSTEKVTDGVKKYFEWVEGINEAIENQARFASYCASRMQHRSVSRAVNDAKEITLNFNRTGAGFGTHSLNAPDGSKLWRLNRDMAALTASALRHTQWFFNPAVQGMSKMCDLATGGDAAQKARFLGVFVATPILGGLAANTVSQMVANFVDDDEERMKYGDNPYDQLPEHVRRNNMCLYMGHGRFVTIPIAIEQRPAYAIADICSRAARGIPSDSDIQNPVLDIMSQMTQLTPFDLGGGSKVGYDDVRGALLGLVTPSILQPIVAVGTNVAWTGSPVHNRNNYNASEAEWQRGLRTTDKAFVEFAKALSKATGGDEAGVMGGAIDINPAIMQYITESYVGGPGKEASEIVRIFSEDRDLSKLPIVKAWLRSSNPEYALASTKKRWFKYSKEYLDETKPHMKGFAKHLEVDEYNLLRNSKKGKIGAVVGTFQPIIKKINEARNNAQTKEQRDYYSNLADRYIKEAMNAIDRIEKE